MKNLTTSCLVVLLGTALLACSPVQRLNKTNVKGDSFTQALFEKYKAFAKSEEKQADWRDANHFAEKAMRAAHGEKVLPEDPTKWARISKEHLPELKDARSKLLHLLNDKKIFDRHPVDLAAAQYYFDCWVEQQDENWQLDEIQVCRSAFYNELYKLGHGQRQDVTNKYNIIETDEKFVHKVFFPFDKNQLDAKGKKFVEEIAINYKNEGLTYNFVVNGYADKVGDASYNLALSKKRAEAVKNALVKNGINADMITVNAYGFDHNAVETDHNEREPLNRRVEVRLVESK